MSHMKLQPQDFSANWIQGGFLRWEELSKKYRVSRKVYLFAFPKIRR